LPTRKPFRDGDAHSRMLELVLRQPAIDAGPLDLDDQRGLISLT
jgi:hypothetical protein